MKHFAAWYQPAELYKKPRRDWLAARINGKPWGQNRRRTQLADVVAKRRPT
jgi:hypothetical protein